MTSTTVAIVVCLGLLGAFISGEMAASRVRRVVGGQRYAKGAYPYSVSLWYMADNNPYTVNTPDLHHTCGGILISDQWVLTAAVCFDDNYLPGLANVSNWQVVLGMTSQREAHQDAQFTTIDYVVTNPRYVLSAIAYADLALLRLTDTANLTNPLIDTVNINIDKDCPVSGDTCTVVGWGQEREQPYGNGSDIPHEVNVQIISKSQCEKDWNVPEITDFLGKLTFDSASLCAGVQGGGKDACYGDSGSPLLCSCGSNGDLVATGIVSYGYGCGHPNVPSVYTRISDFAEFITDTVAVDA